MSYAVRNTLVLLIVLVLLVAGGWAFIYFSQTGIKEELEGKLLARNQELRQKQEVARRYEGVLEQFEQVQDFFRSYDKSLYQSHNEDMVFDFLDRLNRGSTYTDFTFAFEDSVSHGDYGVMHMSIAGSGYFHNFMNLVNQIEYSKPLNKILKVSITPVNELESYGMVNYKFKLESYYDRARLLDQPSLEIVPKKYASVYNPFFPLIRDVKPNTDELPNVEQSRLLALSSDKIFLLDQKGVMQRLQVGDRVYLGTLITIDLKRGTASFKLNKGGIIEQVTLEVNNDDL